jgi:hypothetical protein
MTAHRKPIDHRPFRSKTEHRLETNLTAQYRGLAIRGLVAALAPGKERGHAKAAKSLTDG